MSNLTQTAFADGSVSGEARSLVLFSLTGCAPCDVAEDAMTRLADRSAFAGWSFVVSKVDAGDKRAVGRAFKAGLTVFPTVKTVVGGEVLNAYTRVPEDWSAEDVAAFLGDRLAAIDEAG